MSLYRKLDNFSEQCDKIRNKLPDYLYQNGIISIQQYEQAINGNLRGIVFQCQSGKHADTHPSMNLIKGEKDGIFRCYCQSCRTTMDIFQVASILEGFPSGGPTYVSDNVAKVAEQFDIELSFRQVSPEEELLMQKHSAYEDASKYISNNYSSLTDRQKEELEFRGYKESDLIEQGFGGCSNYDDMSEHLVGLGYSATFLSEIEILKKNIFNPNTIVYTIRDMHGRAIGFVARNLLFKKGDPDSGPKFISTGDRSFNGLMSKRHTLYKLDVARKQLGTVILVEGINDCLTLHIHGQKNVVCIFGTEVFDEQLEALRLAGCYDITICLDNDEAGRRRMKELVDNKLSHIPDFKFSIKILPDLRDEAGNIIKTDPDLLVRKLGVSAFTNAVTHTLFQWKLDQYSNGLCADEEAICRDMIPMIVNEPSHLAKEQYVRVLSEYTGYSTVAIQKEIDEIEKERKNKFDLQRKRVVSDLVNKLSSSNMAPELILNSGLDELYAISKSAKEGIFDSANRISTINSIKAYQESTTIERSVSLGSNMAQFAKSIDGDISGKIVYIGGASNSGKTSLLVNICWRILREQANKEYMCLFLSIDDSLEEIIPRFISLEACLNIQENKDKNWKNKWRMININSCGNPTSVNGDIYRGVIDSVRDDFYKKLNEYMINHRFMIYDTRDGRSLDFIDSMLKHYSEMYPSRRIILFLDNFHLLQLGSMEGSVTEGREKYASLSRELKALVVKYKATLFSSVEYHKMPPDMKPNNNNISESGAIVYDSSAIFHGFNALHGLRENAKEYFWTKTSNESTQGTKYPIVSFAAGKNKITSFKGDLHFKFFPDKAFFTEMTQQELDEQVRINEMTKDYVFPEIVEDETNMMEDAFYVVPKESQQLGLVDTDFRAEGD